MSALYVDGFNLYYRALKDSPFRWLDLHRLADALFPQDSIGGVSYFTSRLDTRPDNPGGAVRHVRDGLGLRVVLVNPDPRNPSPDRLADSATYVKRLGRSHLRHSQFPDTLSDEIGTIAKPPAGKADRKIQMAGRIGSDDGMRVVAGSLAERRSLQSTALRGVWSACWASTAPAM